MRARTGASVGTNRPVVRFDGTKYVLMTRFTSSAVTRSTRSRWMNMRRQSPVPAHSLNSRAMRCELLNASSKFRMRAAFARSTSASVTGSLRSPSMTRVSVAYASSSGSVARTFANTMNGLGSLSWNASAFTDVACRVATRSR
jgi:hypothetical protein